MTFSRAWFRSWSNASRAERLYLIGIIALGLALLANLFVAASERNDMDIYLLAAQDMLQGENMYLQKYNTWYSYLYSPLFALLVSPLLYLDLYWAKVLWGFLGLCAAFRTFQLCIRMIWPQHRPFMGILPVVLLSLVFLFQAVRDNLNAMQVTLILVWLCLEALRLAFQGRWFVSGALLAFGIDMKMIPLVLLPYLLWRKEWRPVVATVLVLATLQFVPALAIGWDRNRELQSTRMEILDPGAARHVIDEEEPSFISLGSVLSAYLSSKGGNDHSPDLPRQVTELSVEQLGILLTIGRLILAGSVLLVLRNTLFHPPGSSQVQLHEVAYLLLVSVLVFPHQRPYSMFLAAPAVIWLTHWTLPQDRTNEPNPRWWLVLCAMLYLIVNSDLLLGEYSTVYAHYKILSFATLVLLAMLIRARPERLPDTLQPTH